MNIATVSYAMRKRAAGLTPSDAVLSVIPGISTGIATYGISGLIPKLKERKGLRVILAALSGAGAMTGLGAYFYNKNQELEDAQATSSRLNHDLDIEMRENARLLNENWNSAAEHGRAMRDAEMKADRERRELRSDLTSKSFDLSRMRSDLDYAKMRNKDLENTLKNVARLSQKLSDPNRAEDARRDIRRAVSLYDY